MSCSSRSASRERCLSRSVSCTPPKVARWDRTADRRACRFVGLKQVIGRWYAGTRSAARGDLQGRYRSREVSFDPWDDLFARAAAEKLDLVLLAGDYLQLGGQSFEEERARLQALLATLKPRLGIWAVEGNVEPREWARLFEGTDARVFGRTKSVQIADGIAITGLTLDASFNTTISPRATPTSTSRSVAHPTTRSARSTPTSSSPATPTAAKSNSPASVHCSPCRASRTSGHRAAPSFPASARSSSPAASAWNAATRQGCAFCVGGARRDRRGSAMTSEAAQLASDPGTPELAHRRREVVDDPRRFDGATLQHGVRAGQLGGVG